MTSEPTVHHLGQVDAALIERTVCRAVTAVAPDPGRPAEPQHHLVDDLGYDSLRLVELSVLLEDLFDIDLTTVEPPPVGAVRDLADFVREMVGSGLAMLADEATIDEILQGRQ
jgi:acyl carrier protein